RLPITAHDFKAVIGIYTENRERFTNAVKEFTGFLCQSNISDVTQLSPGSPYSPFAKASMGRYDNFIPYLEDDGKIGLIDLVMFTPHKTKSNERGCFDECETVILLFPYHLEAILETAKQFDPDIEIYRLELEAVRD